MNDYDIKLIREVYEIVRNSEKGKSHIQCIIEETYNMDLDLVQQLYNIVLSNSSDFYQFGICRNLRDTFPEAFIGALVSEPFQTIPRIKG